MNTLLVLRRSIVVLFATAYAYLVCATFALTCTKEQSCTWEWGLGFVEMLALAVIVQLLWSPSTKQQPLTKPRDILMNKTVKKIASYITKAILVVMGVFLLYAIFEPLCLLQTTCTITENIATVVGMVVLAFLIIIVWTTPSIPDKKDSDT